MCLGKSGKCVQYVGVQDIGTGYICMRWSLAPGSRDATVAITDRQVVICR